MVIIEMEMNEDANTQLLKTAYEKYAAGDFSGLIEHLSDDIEMILPEVENSPLGGIWHGRADAIKYFELRCSTEDQTDYEVREIIADGDRVAVHGRLTATARSTGRHYSTEWVHLLTLQNKLIKSFCSFYDTAAALRAYQMVTTALK